MVQKSKYGSTEKEVSIKDWLEGLEKSDPARYNKIMAGDEAVTMQNPQPLQ